MLDDPLWNRTWQGQPAPWRVCFESSYKGSSDNRIPHNMRTTRVVSLGYGKLTSATSTPRVLEWAVPQQRATGRRFLVANTHLDAQVTDAYRVTQMTQALAVVAAHGSTPARSCRPSCSET